MSDGNIKPANVVFVRLREWDETAWGYVESIIACKNETKSAQEVQAEFDKPPLAYAIAFRP